MNTPTSVQLLSASIAGAALAVSLIALLFSWWSWRQSNRPIVTAFVTEVSSGEGVTVFNLVISNTGNRPAVNVCMSATSAAIDQILEPAASDDRKASTRKSFGRGSAIPLLRNGEDLTSSFGAAMVNSPDGPWLRYGVQIDVELSYQSLDGRRFSNHQPLKIHSRRGFAGGTWEDPK